VRPGHGGMAGGIVAHTHGADSEVGRLRTVLLHRPGPELRRISPHSRGRVLFDRLPWADRAQQEHDTFSQVLREHGVEVLYLTELLQEVLEYADARAAAIASVLSGPQLGDELRGLVRGHLDDLESEPLAQALIAGLTPAELRGGRGLVYNLLGRHDFVVDPLPNLVFTGDSSAWIGDQVAVASLAAPGRDREAALLAVLYRHHPRFAGTTMLYGPYLEPLAGADIVLLAPGVLAVGVSERTSPAGAERLARQVFAAGLARTVLAVPIQRTGAGHLDTVCTVVDTGVVVMHPALAYTLTAHAITWRDAELRVSRPQPFLAAAAEAIGVDRLTVIGTGLDPLTAPGGQWDDGGNALSLGRGLAVCDERNRETNERLAAAGVRVVTVPASELGSGRGGPRCLSCVITRDPAGEPAQVPAAPPPDLAAGRGLPPMPRPVPAVSDPRGLPVGGPQLARIRLGSRWLADHFGQDAERRARPAPHAAPAAPHRAGRIRADAAGVQRLVQVDQAHRQLAEPEHLLARLGQEGQVARGHPGRHRHHAVPVQQLAVVPAALQPRRGGQRPVAQAAHLLPDLVALPVLVRRPARRRGSRRLGLGGLRAAARLEQVPRQRRGQRHRRRRLHVGQRPQSGRLWF
jgi:arginine deiminase